jgi:FAD/FMN-containing dehydrogenase
MLPTGELRDDIAGRFILPGDDDYDAARRVVAGNVDRRPALIARVAGADDVARVIALARETGHELAVRGGGHSNAGHGVSEGGIVLDMRDMRGLEIDADQRTAWAQAGLTAGGYTKAADAHALATGFGDTASVGVAGITLAGGAGFLARKHGLTIDHLLAAEVVTADGELVRADAGQHPDLFWALRGGGGNFGVVTRLKYRLHEVGTIVGGMLILPASADVIAAFLEAAHEAPDELSTIANVMKAPPMPFLPAEAHGRMIVMAQLVYAGDVDAGQRVLDRFRALATPIADMTRPMRYPEIFPPEDPDYRPTAVVRTMYVNGVDRDKGQAIVERIQTATAPMAVAQLRVLGGAVARVSPDATAFAHRRSPIMANVVAMYQGEDHRAEQEAWVAALTAELYDGADGAYAGFLADEGAERVRAAYPGATWDRLREVKATYDPDNVFRLNQNVPPG